MYLDVDRVAPLPCQRLAPVDSAVRLLDCVENAARGGLSAPFGPTSLPAKPVPGGAGAGGPEDPPSEQAAVVTAAQKQILVLKELRRAGQDRE